MHAHACRVAAALEPLAVAGEPVLLLYPTGLEYIAAFFGCLAAGAIAVPAYPPRPGRARSGWKRSYATAAARVALTTATASPPRSIAMPNRPTSLRMLSPSWRPTSCPAADGRAIRPTARGPDTVAFLQYTSGSTGDPKGVVVTHGNLLHNLSAICRRVRHPASRCRVSWLPIYHDMGLIGGVLAAVVCRRIADAVVAQAISGATTRLARGDQPIRGHACRRTKLCLRLVPATHDPGTREKLDLSQWRVAFCGAEPIRQETLARFCEAFAPAGFRADAFRPCYGLAEATLMVTARKQRRSAAFAAGLQAALEQGQVRRRRRPRSTRRLPLVASGTVVAGQRVVIVDPETCRRIPPGRIGEIWVQGPSVAGGYWKRQQLSAKVFAAHLADTGEGPFLRTGDLGCFHEGQLFVTGRIKELIIVRGRNHYPQDIELTAEASHADLQAGGGRAFSFERRRPGTNRACARSPPRGGPLARRHAVIRAVCQAVAREHEMRLDAVGLAQARQSLPHDQRQERTPRLSPAFRCRPVRIHRVLAIAQRQRFGPAGRRRAPGQGDLAGPGSPSSAVPPTAAALIDWVSGWLARRLELAPGEIDASQPLAVYGLDSLMAVELMHDVEQTFGRRLDVGLLVDAPSIADLAQRVAGDAPLPIDTAEALSAWRRAAGLARSVWRSCRRHSGAWRIGDARDDALFDAPPQRKRRLSRQPNTTSAGRLRGSTQYNLRHTQSRATLLDLFLWASAYVAHARPGMNRFISGRRIYQRREVAISFAAKKRYELTAELVTVKLTVPGKSGSLLAMRRADRPGRRPGLPRAATRRRSRNRAVDAIAPVFAPLRPVGLPDSRSLQSLARQTHRKRPTLRDDVCR